MLKSAYRFLDRHPSKAIYLAWGIPEDIDYRLLVPEETKRTKLNSWNALFTWIDITSIGRVDTYSRYKRNVCKVKCVFAL